MSQIVVRARPRVPISEARRQVLALIRAKATRQTLGLVNSEVHYTLELTGQSVTTTVMHAGPAYFHTVSFVRGSDEVYIFHFYAADLLELCSERP